MTFFVFHARNRVLTTFQINGKNAHTLPTLPKQIKKLIWKFISPPRDKPNNGQEDVFAKIFQYYVQSVFIFVTDITWSRPGFYIQHTRHENTTDFLPINLKFAYKSNQHTKLQYITQVSEVFSKQLRTCAYLYRSLILDFYIECGISILYYIKCTLLGQNNRYSFFFQISSVPLHDAWNKGTIKTVLQRHFII